MIMKQPRNVQQLMQGKNIQDRQIKKHTYYNVGKNEFSFIPESLENFKNNRETLTVSWRADHNGSSNDQKLINYENW